MLFSTFLVQLIVKLPLIQVGPGHNLQAMS